MNDKSFDIESPQTEKFIQGYQMAIRATSGEISAEFSLGAEH